MPWRRTGSIYPLVFHLTQRSPFRLRIQLSHHAATVMANAINVAPRTAPDRTQNVAATPNIGAKS